MPRQYVCDQAWGMGGESLSSHLWNVARRSPLFMERRAFVPLNNLIGTILSFAVTAECATRRPLLFTEGKGAHWPSVSLDMS